MCLALWYRMCLLSSLPCDWMRKMSHENSGYVSVFLKGTLVLSNTEATTKDKKHIFEKQHSYSLFYFFRCYFLQRVKYLLKWEEEHVFACLVLEDKASS